MQHRFLLQHYCSARSSLCRRRGRSAISLLLLGIIASGCTRGSLPAPPDPPAITIPSQEEAAAAPELALPPPPSSEAIAAAAQKRIEGLDKRNQGNLTAAIASFDAAVNLDPTNLNGLVLLGWTLHLNGQGDRAADTLQRALGRDADHIPALNALGIVYLVAGELGAAVATHTRATELDPNNEIAFYNLSLAYERLQQFDRAIATAIRATELEPGNPHPWVALALAHWSNGEIPQAQQQYRQAIALDSRYRAASYLEHLLQAGFAPAQVDRTRSLLAALP